MALPKDEHDDDVSPTVSEGAAIEIERFPQVAEDFDDVVDEGAPDADREVPRTGLNDDAEDESPDEI